MTVRRVALITLCLAAACSRPAPQEEAAAPPAVQVAFAGGGWRAHTAHAAWILSLLDDGAYTLDEVFAHVDTLASNSGGTWFLSMLAYSANFTQSLAAPGAFKD